jgi:hypothetical protein
MFLGASTVLGPVCGLASTGLKACVDLGLHLKENERRFGTAFEYEMYKRAFWALLYLERVIAAHLGRHTTLADVR